MEHGSGLRTFPSGAVYFGEWLEGVRQGKGNYKDKNAGVSYDGYYVRNMRSGFGIEKREGTYYKEGMWKNDVQEGQGRVVVYAEDGTSGLEYKGEFKNG